MTPEEQATEGQYLPRQPPPGPPLTDPIANPWPHGQHQQQTDFGTTEVPLEHANRGGAGRIGGLAGGGYVVFKLLSAGKFALLAVAKAPLLLSLFANIVVYTLVFGAQNPLLGVAFATGFVGLIFVHEMGHLVAARMEGINASVPFFIPFMGAAIFLKDHPRNARSEAIIGIGGPILGTVATLVMLSLAGTFNPSTTLGLLFIRLAYYGFFINLFNMIPLTPLDGGRILGAVSKWFNVVGLGLIVFGIVEGFLTSPILWLIIALGAYGTYKRFRHPEHTGYYEISAGTRMVIGFSYLLLLAILIGGVVATEPFVINQ
ncbi:MAG: site-2 protease family protein [Candidatus Dormibacteria bacterium]